MTAVIPSIFIFCSLLFLEFCKGAYRSQITYTESIKNNETLVSPNGRFELGFFSPNTANNKSYIGIWYKSFPDIVAWVANRETPLTDSLGTLTINRDGNLVLLNSSNSIIWSSNVSSSVTTPVQSSSVVELLDSGNLILIQNRSSVSGESYLWQSFDHPGDTLLPGMKISWDRSTSKTRKLTSWVDTTDPSPGNFVYEMDVVGLPQLVTRKGSEKKLFRTGVWNGLRLSGLYKSVPTSPIFSYNFTYDTEGISFFYPFTDNPVITRFVLNQSGVLQRYVIDEGSPAWSLAFFGPNDYCDEYARCGPNGICKITNSLICDCLHGFIPKYPSAWNVLDRKGGCIRKTPLDCGNGDGFLWLKNVKLPDLLAQEYWLNESMSLKECEQKCSSNCSCTAYTNSNISGRGSGCLIWYGDLIDIKVLLVAKGSEHGVYIRLAASDLNHNQKKKIVVIISVFAAVSALFSVVLLIWCRLQTLKKRRGKNQIDIDLPFFDLATLSSATDHFSDTNLIGSGGFGPVYKGLLSNEEIAVKRLSKDSGQGTEEFENEIILISKLQHRNLVKILGWCLEGTEKLLVYEYMPNQSLDNFIFDERRMTLNWPRRFEISMGIAKGLVYLHQDSRLRIIHRDLKASNVLLDSELNPKIADFGIARIFGGDQNEAKTKFVIGTYGYMSPEYIIDGKFSTKSDVFSYGVLLLEIVSGAKNNKFLPAEQYHNLLGHAWLLWNEGRAFEVMDRCLEDSCVKSQVERCVKISLLCVQRLPKDRPTMSSVVSMLGSEDVLIPEPKKPGFFIEQCLVPGPIPAEVTSVNQVTVTALDGR